MTRGLGEYGLGFFVEQIGKGTSFGHSGGTQGFRSQLYGYTHTGQGIVVMTNSENGAALSDEILTRVATEYGWPEFQVLEKSAIAADPAMNAAIAGDYELVGQSAHLTADGDRLYFQSDVFGKQRMELFRESNTGFFMTAQDMSIHFERDGNDQVIGFSLVRGATTYPGTRRR